MTRVSGHLGDWLQFRNGKSSPERTPSGQFPVFGSNGEIGRANVSNVEQSATVIGRVGSYCGSTWYSTGPAWVTDNAIIATAADSGESRFWYYALRFLDLNRVSHGSGQPLLNQTILRELPFTAPAPPERLAIAATLGALDDKIESNRRKQGLAWELVATEWEQLSHNGEPAIIGDLLTLAYGKALPAKNRVAGDVPVYGSSGLTGLHNEALVTGPAVIVGRKGTVGVAHWSHVDAFPIDTTFFVKPIEGWPLLACLFALRSAGLTEMNSDSAVPGLNRDRAHAAEVLVPDLRSAVEWSARHAATLRLIRLLDNENTQLTGLRDTLLPELLSGRIRVSTEGVAA